MIAPGGTGGVVTVVTLNGAFLGTVSVTTPGVNYVSGPANASSGQATFTIIVGLTSLSTAMIGGRFQAFNGANSYAQPLVTTLSGVQVLGYTASSATNPPVITNQYGVEVQAQQQATQENTGVYVAAASSSATYTLGGHIGSMSGSGGLCRTARRAGQQQRRHQHSTVAAVAGHDDTRRRYTVGSQWRVTAGQSVPRGRASTLQTDGALDVVTTLTAGSTAAQQLATTWNTVTAQFSGSLASANASALSGGQCGFNATFYATATGATSGAFIGSALELQIQSDTATLAVTRVARIRTALARAGSLTAHSALEVLNRVTTSVPSTAGLLSVTIAVGGGRLHSR